VKALGLQKHGNRSDTQVYLGEMVAAAAHGSLRQK
jgi:hypothetical protein